LNKAIRVNEEKPLGEMEKFEDRRKIWSVKIFSFLLLFVQLSFGISKLIIWFIALNKRNDSTKIKFSIENICPH